MTGATDHDYDAQELIQSRLAELRGLSYRDVQGFSEVHVRDVMLQGRMCSLTTFVQKLPSGALLASVQVAQPRFLGLVSMHMERGLVFEEQGGVREATAEELQNSGG
jgi:hypothetical protein